MITLYCIEFVLDVRLYNTIRRNYDCIDGLCPANENTDIGVILSSDDTVSDLWGVSGILRVIEVKCNDQYYVDINTGECIAYI